MSQENEKSNRPRVLGNQRGQMALFLVLVFQILFVFFAMSINVGLVVYDKINLQNSTDIAAYYAAQKQSEMLNQIAHINYQLRQAYKLLTFRIRVIGSVSIGISNSNLKRHPLFENPNMAQEANPFFERLGARQTPAVCIGSTLWEEYARTEGSDTVSLCNRLDGFSRIPTIGGGDDRLGLTGDLNDFLVDIARELEQKCKVVGVLNWQVAASFLNAYILESQRRTAMIRNIANKMSQPAQEMTDDLGESVYSGVLKTLQKNLTEPQRTTLQMTLQNSLSADVEGPCSDPNYWLANIEIYPAVTYVRMKWDDPSCNTEIVSNRSAANLPQAEYIAMVGGRDNNMLRSVWASAAPVVAGVEKNPWCMPYMKVTAQTRPRKIFSPFGGEVSLRAEAFAKPFGGRVGPWYSRQWPSGSGTSLGPEKVDPLLPARSISGGRQGGAVEDDLVNHSKYPGDTLGMNSTYALGAMSPYWSNQVLRGARLDRLPPVFSLRNYNHVGSPVDFDSQPDSLVKGDLVRAMEETAVAPDLFDITYYSIEGQYSANYFNNNQENFNTAGEFGSSYFLDLGSINRQPYSVVEQIAKANSVFSAQSPFYQVDSPNYLLTGWTQNQAVNYDFPVDKFGRCIQRNDQEVTETPSPGGCPQGGRSGYSVKLVSKNYLLNIDADLGGPGNSGPILNPPPQ
jgi:hypothetical protein